MTERRFRNSKRKFSRWFALYEQYMAFMQEYVKLGHMRKVRLNSWLNITSCHIMILSRSRVIIKVRVAFDDFAKSSTEFFEWRATNQDNFLSILIHFRIYFIVLNIEKNVLTNTYSAPLILTTYIIERNLPRIYNIAILQYMN